MFENLPVEIQEAIIYNLIELDHQERNSFIHPYTGKSRHARSLAALSQVNWNVRSVCESFLWKTIGFGRPRKHNELEALSDIGSRTRHIRSLHARVCLSNNSLCHSGIIDHTCLEFLTDLKDFLTNLSRSTLKHVRLHTPCDIELNRLIWFEHANKSLFNQLKTAHREVTYALFNFPLLTSLDISGACYAFVPEDDIAQCIQQLPHLVRFRAHNSVAPLHVTEPQRLMLGRALAQLRLLEELSIQNLDTPDQSWCDLDWKGPLKVLSIKRCLSLTGAALYEFILKFPTITDIRLINQFEQFEQSDDPYTFRFQFQHQLRSLKNFTFFGIQFNTDLFHILLEAPNLGKLHIHSAHRHDLLEKMKQSIEVNDGSWPGLKSLVFSSVAPENETRIWLENWALERQVRIKFHGTRQVPFPAIVDHVSEGEDGNQIELDLQNQNHVETEDVHFDTETSMSNSNDNVNATAEASLSDIVDAVADVNLSDVGEDQSFDGNYFVEEEFDEYADLYDGLPSPEEFLSQIEAAEAAAIQPHPAVDPQVWDPEFDIDDFDGDLSGPPFIEENADVNDALDDDDIISVPGSYCSELEELEDWTSTTWIRDHE